MFCSAQKVKYANYHSHGDGVGVRMGGQVQRKVFGRSCMNCFDLYKSAEREMNTSAA